MRPAFGGIIPLRQLVLSVVQGLRLKSGANEDGKSDY